ncbi:MAG: hypothetical protein JNL53_13380 [Cyclobacteriaceae bacterium]|nr:hypothetical protein [Cyclobacteriaceae bacterium]
MKLTLFLICTFSISTFSQKLENLKAVSTGDSIVITYDLIADLPGDKYEAKIYSSYDNFASPLRYISGDIGNSLTPGIGKRIVWEAKKELGNYQGDLSFEIRAEIRAIFEFKNSVSSAKRGKSLSVAWRGGIKNEDVKVVLLKEGIEQSLLSTSANSGGFNWSVPAGHKTGGGYQIRLENGKEIITSNIFSIKHKVPTAVKILPVVVIGVAVLFSSKPKGEENKNTDLATPPDLGLN